MTKILLVEDDKSLREIYGVRLLAEGYDIISAGDGEEALAMAIKERPALIVSDVMMPKISGFDMLDILRSTTETKTIKVIMMTALSSEDQRKRGEELGADRYLVKSQVGIEDVVRTVHEVLEDNGMVGASSSGSQPLAAAPQPQAFGSQPQPAPAAPAPQQQPASAPSFGAPRPAQMAPPARPTVEPTRSQDQSTSQQQTQSTQTAAPAASDEQPSLEQQPTPTPQPQSFSQPSAPQPSSDASTLPQPTAPFSTNRPGSGSSDRVIEPMERVSEESPDALAARIAAELGVPSTESSATDSPSQSDHQPEQQSAQQQDSQPQQFQPLSDQQQQ
jgi:CheY-like chemotaxis protein